LAPQPASVRELDPRFDPRPPTQIRLQGDDEEAFRVGIGGENRARRGAACGAVVMVSRSRSVPGRDHEARVVASITSATKKVLIRRHSRAPSRPAAQRFPY
jgi:hypothetical protein